MLLVANSARKVHVVRRPPEEIDWDDNQHFERCPFPRARVATQPANGPNQQWWNPQVIEAKQAHQQWDRRIEHVLGPADEVMARHESSEQIDRVQRLKEQ